MITYRTEAEVESWRRKDPLVRFRLALEGAGLLEDGEYEGRLVARARDTVSQAAEFALWHAQLKKSSSMSQGLLRRSRMFDWFAEDAAAALT